MATLIERAADRIGIGNEVAELFVDNARMKHGVPARQDTGKQVSVEITHKHEGLPTTPTRIETAPATRTDAEPSKVASVAKKLWPYVTAAAVAAGGGGSLLGWWVARDSAPEAPAVASDSTGSLLQYLEDNGQNWPEGTR